MGLAGPRVAERDDVLPAQDELAAGQFEHQHLVEAGKGREVEGVEALHGREPGGPDPSLDGAALPVDQLQLDQAQQVAGMVNALPGALARDPVVLPKDRRQLQLLEVMGEQNLRRAARCASLPRMGGCLSGHEPLLAMRTA
jgi:hypothetical protein